jgi:hypothetical protein
MLLAPALLLSMWNPLWTGALRSSAQAQEGVGMLALEWHDFTSHRLKEDLDLMQRLTRCDTSHQIMAECVDFWQRAAADYGKVLTTMSKLMTGVTAKMVTAAQSAADEPSANLLRSRDAA